ncbi:MAG: tripartite tricarboxylate transporter substrate-binding protein [Pseudomonadota bacterium]
MRLVSISVLAAVAFASSVQAQTFPDGEIEIIVNYGSGGAVDRTARSVQRFLPDALGQNVVVENIGGAGGRLGIEAYLERPADGYHVLTSFAPATTYVATTNPDLFGLDDLAVINVQWIDPAILVARNDRGWGSLDDAIAAIEAEPGRYTFGSSGATSVGHVLAMNLFDELGLDVRVVPYEGGGATRAAFLAGEVDMTAAGVQGALRVQEEATPIALFWDSPVDVWPEAVPVNSALGDDASVEIGGAYRFHAVHASVAEEYPERFEALVEAFRQTTLENDEFIAFADETNVGRDWRGPEASTELLEQVESSFSVMFQ